MVRLWVGTLNQCCEAFEFSRNHALSLPAKTLGSCEWAQSASVTWLQTTLLLAVTVASWSVHTVALV